MNALALETLLPSQSPKTHLLSLTLAAGNQAHTLEFEGDFLRDMRQIEHTLGLLGLHFAHGTLDTYEGVKEYWGDEFTLTLQVVS